MRAAAVVVAGGSGRRMGAAGGTRKQYLEIDGEPVLLRAIRPLVHHRAVEQVVVVLPADDAEQPPQWLRDLPVTLVAGGAERGDSVWNGLAAVDQGVDVVLVHDGARPFLSPEVVDRVLEAAAEGGAIAAIPATDTIKEVDQEGRVIGTADRSRLWHAQTPQGFPVAVLREAYRRARSEGWQVTDDASLCERAGVRVRVVLGAFENIKITRPSDLLLAEALARALRPRPADGISDRDPLHA